MTNAKRLRRLEAAYGQPPELTYFAGDMTDAQAYYDRMSQARPEDFFLDDTTWDDLDMDEVFKRLNLGESTAGEQYLYYQLRCPAMDGAEFVRRAAAPKRMEKNPSLRLKLQGLLSRLGRRSHVDVLQIFDQEKAPAWALPLFIFLALLVPALVCALVLTRAQWVLPPLLCVLVANPLLRQKVKSKKEWQIATVAYCASMVMTARKISAFDNEELSQFRAEAQGPLSRLSRFKGAGFFGGKDDLAEILNGLLLLDLITYESQKNLLLAHREDFLTLFRLLGELDAAICVASWRRTLPVWTVPELDFSAAGRRLAFHGLVHPLVANCVPNDLETENSLLITGSNASGKTTFLRAAALNLILSQGVCTALARDLRASRFRVCTSIQIADDVLSGQSYYMAEMRSLLRVLEAARTPSPPVFCCLDEIFRGTNAVERIAASSQCLAWLGERCLYMAATHDSELCDLLPAALCYFEERVVDDEMFFDYTLKLGRSKNSNAIRFMEVMGFPDEIVARARKTAAEFRRT